MAKEELYIEAKLDAEQLYQDLKALKSEIEKKNMDIKVNAKLTKDAQQVSSQVDNIAQANNKAAKAAEDSAEATNKLNKALESSQQVYQSLSPEIQQQMVLVGQLEEQYKTLRQAMKDPANATDEFRGKLQAAKIALADARKELNRMTAPIKETTKESKGLFGVFKNIGSSSLRTGILSTFGAFSIAGAIAKTLRGLINTVKESIQTFISFESAFAGVKKTVEATDYQFDSFNRTLKDMTTYVPMAYEDLAKIAELGGQMGVPIENLAKFTETLAALSVSTNLGLEDAALTLSRISSVMGLDYGDVDRLGSAIVDLGNNFAATESEITTFMEKISGVGHVVGLSAGDVTGISAAITSVGIAAEKGGTAVNKLLISINDAAVQGGEKLNTLAEITGMTAKEFQELRKTDAGEAFVQVIEGMGKAGDGAIKYIEALVGTGTRAKEVFLNLSSAGDKLRLAVTMGNEAYRENMALMEEAAKRYGTTESQIQMLNNQIRLNKETLGKELIPMYIKLKEVLVNISNTLVGVLKWYNELSRGAQNGVLAGAIGTLTTLLYMINPIAGVLFAAVSGGTVLFNKWANAVKGATDALGKLKDDMKGVNDELYLVEKDIAKLNEDFEKGKITIDEYSESLAKLTQRERELKQAQQELSKEIAAGENIKTNVEGFKQAFEERVVALDNLGDAILQVKSDMEELDEAIIDLSQQYETGRISQEEYKKKMESLLKTADHYNTVLRDLEKQEESAKDELKEYGQAYQDTAVPLQTLSKYTKDQIALNKLFNDIQLDTTASQESLSYQAAEFERVRKEAIAAAKAVIAEKEAFLSVGEFDENKGFFKYAGEQVLSFIHDVTGGTKRAKTALAEAKAELEILENLTFETFVKGTQAEKTLTTNKLLGIDPNDGSLDQLQQKLYEVNKQMGLYKKGTEEWNALAKMQTDLQERITELQKELNEELEDNITNNNKLKQSEEDLYKIKEEMLELEARNKVLALQQNVTSEENYAKAVIKINEDLEKAKADLRKDWYEKEVEAMNEIIEKYKELRDEAEKAMSGLAGDVKKVSSDIASLVKKIQDLRKQLQELEEKRVTSLGDRYVDLQKDLEEIDKQISELNAKTSERGETGETVTEAWDAIQESIDKATDNVKNYKKEIEKLEENMKKLEKDTSNKLSDRYADVVEEIQKLNKEMEVYKYDILTDADAKAKAKLEEDIAKLLSEKNKIEENLTDAQLARAESMIGETKTDKILREAVEQKAAYKEEIADYEDKLVQQNNLLKEYRTQESEMIEKYNFLDTKSNEAKYKEMIKQLEEYKKQRDKIVSEMDYISQNITTQQIQEAIIRGKMTESELIMENYYTQKHALEAELDDYENQLNKKLELLSKYYGDVSLLQQKYGDIGGVSFSDDDLKKLKEAAENLRGVKETTAYSNYDGNVFKTQQEALKEQKQAQKSLDNIAKNLDKLTDNQLKSMGTDALKEFYAKILELQVTASGKGIGTGSVTNTSNINQSFNVSNINDAAVIASAIRRQIKL